MLISDEWRRLNAQHHAAWPGYGSKGDKWAKRVARLVRKTRSVSVLDYGAGKRSLERALWKIDVRSYDPAVPGIDKPPSRADFVVCTDVLEHIEPECLGGVLADLRRLALKAGYLVVALNEGNAILGDGRPAHLIVEPAGWWMERIAPFWSSVETMSCKNKDRLCLFVRS